MPYLVAYKQTATDAGWKLTIWLHKTEFGSYHWAEKRSHNVHGHSHCTNMRPIISSWLNCTHPPTPTIQRAPD